MGCSLTEGVGCYDISTLPRNIIDIKKEKRILHPQFGRVYEINRDRFHEHGWPNHVGKKLGYDKVLNIGLGAASVSSQVKSFMDKYPTELFDDYEVLILFMLPEATRFSFYVNKIINSYLANGSDIGKSYLNIITDITFDPLLEQIFYIKIMGEICDNRGFNFLYFNHDYNLNYFISKIYPNKNQIITTDDDEAPWPDDTNPDDFYSFMCNHPNEMGYELIANRIYYNIKNQFPQYLNTPKDKIEWEYNGDYFDYTNLISNIDGPHIF